MIVEKKNPSCIWLAEPSALIFHPLQTQNKAEFIIFKQRQAVPHQVMES